jgi:hypothetical protein
MSVKALAEFDPMTPSCDFGRCRFRNASAVFSEGYASDAGVGFPAVTEL